MSHRASHPLFIDTNAFVAAFTADDRRHDLAAEVFDGVRQGTLPYGPVFTSRYVLSETATTILVGVGHREAVDALETIRSSSTVNLLDVTPSVFASTAGQFAEYDDQTISFIDHMNSVLAREYDIEHIFAFDDDFATLGLTRVPIDTADLE